MSSNTQLQLSPVPEESESLPSDTPRLSQGTPADTAHTITPHATPATQPPSSSPLAPSSSAVPSRALLPLSFSAATQKLDVFTKSDTYRTALDAARKRYLDAGTALHSARTQLERLIEGAQKPGASAPRSADWIPASLKSKVSARVKFTSVPDDASFYKEHMDIILGAEAKFELIVREQVLAGRRKHIAFLEHRSTPPVILAQEVKEFTRLVYDYADDLDREYGLVPIAASQSTPAAAAAASPAAGTSIDVFPRKEAVVRFERELSKLIDEDKSRTVLQRARAAQEQQRARADDVNAQAFTLAGAHNDKTIAAVAERSAVKIVKPIQAEITDLKRRFASTSRSAATPAYASRPSAAPTQKKRKIDASAELQPRPSRQAMQRAATSASVTPPSRTSTSVSSKHIASKFRFDPVIFDQSASVLSSTDDDTVMDDAAPFPSSGGEPLNTHRDSRQRPNAVARHQQTTNRSSSRIAVQDHDDVDDMQQ